MLTHPDTKNTLVDTFTLAEYILHMITKRETIRVVVNLEAKVHRDLMKLAEQDNRPLGRQVEHMIKYYMENARLR